LEGRIMAIKKDNFPEIVEFNDYVQVYEPALSHDDVMAIAEEFLRTHPKDIIVFGSLQKNESDFAKKLAPRS
jgi:hypothetical protein